MTNYTTAQYVQEHASFIQDTVITKLITWAPKGIMDLQMQEVHDVYKFFHNLGREYYFSN